MPCQFSDFYMDLAKSHLFVISLWFDNDFLEPKVIKEVIDLKVTLTRRKIIIKESDIIYWTDDTKYYEESSSSLKTIGAVKKYVSANKLNELILAPIQIHLLICLKNEAFGSSVDILSTYSWAEHIFELCPQLCAEYRSLNVPIYLPEVMHLVDLYRRSAICY